MKSVLDDLQPEPQLKFDTEGIVHKEFVPPGQMVNGNVYCGVLRRLRSKHPDKWRNNSWAQHHDNAPAHVPLVVKQFLASTNMAVIPHPSYLPDLVPCDFFLFPKMKLKLKGWRFDSVKEIQTESQDVMTLTRNDFQKCFWSWKSRWNRCISAKGDYFEGDRGE